MVVGLQNCGLTICVFLQRGARGSCGQQANKDLHFTKEQKFPS
jgi:hypothetical protein